MSTHRKPDGLTDPPPDFSSQFTVNRRLTPNRRGRVVENDDYAAFLRRAIRAYSRRVAAGDIDAISAMARIARDTDDAIRDAISGLRSIGYSWADIGLRLNISRQAAQQRWGDQRPAIALVPPLYDTSDSAGDDQ
jgi:hypothetical protein